MSTPRRKTAPARVRRRQPAWARWPVERLLKTRICDLDLRIEGTALEARIAQLQDELDRRGLRIRPYYWLSDEWFTPAEMTGVAIPFYLAHPRLIPLQRNRTHEVAGANHAWCMKILRHEVGHVVDHAYRLHLRRRRQRLFGLSSKNYPMHYRPNPYSRRHVQHLYYWYAQSHPDEDFAETFAVWLSPRIDWRRRFAGWPALSKLEYMDTLMAELAGVAPGTRSRARPEPVEKITRTLAEHYTLYRGTTGSLYPAFYDADLLELFSRERGRGRQHASAFLRQLKPELVRQLEPWLGEHRYQLNHVLQDVIGRCRELDLLVVGSPSKTRSALAVLLTKHTMNALFRHRRWVEL